MLENKGIMQSGPQLPKEKDLAHKVHILESQLASVMNSSKSIIACVDENGIIRQWNLAAEKATGVPSGKACGRELEDLFSIDFFSTREVIEAIEKCKNIEASSLVLEQNNLNKSYWDVSVHPQYSQMEKCAVIRLKDVTRRVRFEEMMIQSEKMVSVGGLAAGMAHEINNSLSAIIQNAQVIRNRMSQELHMNHIVAGECGLAMDSLSAYMDKRGLLRMIEFVMDSGIRAATIVGNMLSFSRKSASKTGPNNLNALIDQALDLASNDYDLKKKYDFRRIEIVREYDKCLPAVSCEGVKIQQVMLNLIQNAAHAMAGMDNDGEKPPVLCLRTKKTDQNVIIEVEDSGPGIDEDYCSRIFDPFFTTKAPGSGTGLGLSVSHIIIAQDHGGSIHAESKKGEGARFIIELPY